MLHHLLHCCFHLSKFPQRWMHTMAMFTTTMWQCITKCVHVLHRFLGGEAKRIPPPSSMPLLTYAIERVTLWWTLMFCHALLLFQHLVNTHIPHQLLLVLHCIHLIVVSARNSISMCKKAKRNLLGLCFEKVDLHRCKWTTLKLHSCPQPPLHQAWISVWGLCHHSISFVLLFSILVCGHQCWVPWFE